MAHNCEKVVQLRYLYIDHEMRWWHRARITYHLKRCPPCGAVIHFEARVKNVVARCAGPEAASEGLQDRLRKAIRDMESRDQS